ncbi:MAG: hypothetical protein Ct9H90mP30_5130 [Actinomycetota bacterium]|nr:MAG: hypothetical protein Ct9H90mP30_5130 [Actinomycetota bacterium]
MALQDVQELTNFFEKTVTAYQVGVEGEVEFSDDFYFLQSPNWNQAKPGAKASGLSSFYGDSLNKVSIVFAASVADRSPFNTCSSVSETV